MDAKEYVLGRPTGGVSTRIYPTELQKDEFVMLKNVEPFGSVGAFVTRKGTEAFNSTLPVANKPVRGAFRHYSGNKWQFMIAGTDIWYKTGAAGNFSGSLGTVTEDKDWSFAAYLDYCFLANGTGSYRLSSGTLKQGIGFGAPSSGPTVATGAAGVLTGDYKYKYTWVYDSNTAHESSASSESATVSPSGQKVDLSNIDNTNGNPSKNIYRTKAGGSVFYYLTNIPHGTTTYTDNTPDSSLSATTAPTDNGRPSAPKFIVFWRGRMVVADVLSDGTPVIRFSAISSTEKSPGGGLTVHGAGVEIFPASHYLAVGDDDSDITGLAVIQDRVVVFKEDQIWNIDGDDALSITAWKAQANVGCVAPKTIVNIDGSLFFLGRHGGAPAVFVYDGSSVRNMSLGIEPTLMANIKDLGDTANQPIQPCATNYRGCYLLAYQKTGGSTYEVALLDMRPPQMRWLFADKIEASCFVPWYGPGDDGELYYGHATEARLLRLDSKLTDYHATTPTAVAMTIETGWLDLDHPYHLKQINWIDIYGKEGDQPGGGDPDPGDTTITVERRYDFASSGTTHDCAAVNVSTATKHMGRSLWKHRIHPEGSEGTTPEICYRMKLVITTSAPIEIHRIVINYTPSTPEDTHGQS